LSRVRTRDLVFLSLYGLALSMASSTLDPPIFTAKVNQLVADEGWRNTALGLLTFVGLIVAALSQPVWGALSDHATTRWGRRIPFLVGGSLANLILFALVAFVGDLWLLGFIILLIQLASNAVQGAYQGLIPDQVPPSQHGVAAGVKSLAELPAVILGPLVAGLLLGIGSWSVTVRVLAVVGFLQVLYVIVTLVTLYRARNEPTHQPTNSPVYQPTNLSASQPAIRQTIRDTFRIDWRANRDLLWWLANRALFWFALLTLRSFLINYVEQVMGLSAEEAQRVTGLLASILGVLTFLIVLPSGFIADRVGRRPLLIVSGVAAALGAFILLSARSLPVMFGAGLFIGLGGGLFITSSWALVTELVPKAEAARYLGITNLATAGGSAAARLTGPLIDGVNHFFDSKTLGYVGVYALVGLLFLLSSWAIYHVSPEHRRALTTER
jgi:MFS family permease